MLPPTLISLLLLSLSTHATTASPSPAIVLDDYIHLMPHNTLFFRRQASPSNLQTFTQSLGGVSALPITSSGNAERPFEVDGDTFNDFATAAQRSCDRQANACSKAANDGGNKEFKVNDCDQQKNACNDAQKSATVTSFGQADANAGGGGGNNNNGAGVIASTNIGPDPQFPDFDLICDA
ncbi:unnamed protein product [Periconia digitata]|uniref:Uncharacterized protein n=1 Tax=Periconia digitata TaxID=1303443 RepID=A0A9W4UKE1_9PLEO|nr:unnamed protein product [Periconia digitata]